MDNVLELHRRLEYYRKMNPFNSFESNSREHIYCHLMFYIPRNDSRDFRAGWHKITVQKWEISIDFRTIEVWGMCWTLSPGLCSFRIKDDVISRIKILEDEPTMQVLYG